MLTRRAVPCPAGGKLDQRELTAALRGLGYHIDEEEGAELFAAVDVGG